MTRRNKWRIVGLAGVAFCVYAYYLGADETSGVGDPSNGTYRVKEPGGDWVVGIPCPEGYRYRGAAQWTEDVSNPLVWWAAVESKKDDIAACCSCDAYFNAHFDASCGRMVQPFDDPETLAESFLMGVGNALGVEDLEIEDARYVDTDKHDALFGTLRSLGVLQQRGEVRLTYSGEKGGKDVTVVYIAAFAFAGVRGGSAFSGRTLYLYRPRSYACPVGREKDGERLVSRLDKGRQDNASMWKRVERIVCERTMNANQQSTVFTQQAIRNLNRTHEMGQRANAALNEQQEMFLAAHQRQQQSQDKWADSWRDVIGEKQNVVDPQSGNAVRVDRAENTYFDASGCPVQMSDDQLRDWSRRNGGGAVGARERFEFANPHLRRANPAQND